MAGCRKHDGVAQEALYRICYPVLMRMALRYAPNNADAADILNRGLFKVLTKIEQFNGNEQNFGGWIKRIVVNEAIDFVRANPAFGTTQGMDAALYLAEDVPNQEQAMEAQNITYLLQQLPPTSAAVFNLFALEGYSHREIGVMLDITEVNSKWHLHNARQRLQLLIRQTATL